MIIADSRTTMLKILPRGGTVVEVGVWRGEYSAELLERLAPARLILIDTWEDYQGHSGEAAHRAVRERFAGDQRVELRRGRSVDELRAMPPASCDLVYIDADHSFAAVLADLEAALPAVRSGGWIAGHDYNACEDYGVVRAVAVFCDRHRLAIDLMTDEPLVRILGSLRRYYPPADACNSFGIRIPEKR